MKKKIKLVKFYHPNLYRKAKDVKSEEIRKIKELILKMKKVVKKKEGVGLAAPQVGISKRVIVVADGDDGYVGLINPEIIEKSTKKIVVKEGCLSLEGVWCEVERFNSVKVKAKNEQGEDVFLEAEGLMAVVLQHEIDHLEGKLFISDFSFFTKIKLIFLHVFKKQKQSQ